MLLPNDPFSGQEFIDADRVIWRFNGLYQLWERVGVAEAIPVADEVTVGLLPATFKAALDGVQSASGGFGIIIHPLMQVNDNSCNLLTGDITLVSDSLNITCFAEDLARNCLTTKPANECCGVDDLNGPNIQFGLKPEFLRNTKVRIRSVKGDRGDCGNRGPKGYSGFCGGPSGIAGLFGDNVERPLKLAGIIYRDLEGITERAIVAMSVSDNVGKGCILKITTSRIGFDNSPASKVQATQLFRTVTYASTTDPCNPVRLQDFTLTKPDNDTTPTDLFLLRPPNKEQVMSGPNGIYISSTVGLGDFVAALASKYDEQLIRADEGYKFIVKING